MMRKTCPSSCVVSISNGNANSTNVLRVERFGYKQDDIVMLVDDARNPRQIPTRANMIAAMQWLVAGAKPNDSLFFHYSGHGGQTKDTDGDEDDGNDEVIYPLDFKQAGHLVDDDLHTLLVKPLPAGCRLTAIFDSCHSARYVQPVAAPNSAITPVAVRSTCRTSTPQKEKSKNPTSSRKPGKD